MGSFDPVAIVGRACVLPDALSPEALWDAVVAGRDLVSSVPPDRWGLSPDDAMCSGPHDSVDRTWSDRGGYVRGFDEVFDPTGFALPADEVQALDPVFRWTFHAAREALRDSGHTGATGAVGAVFGNLSYPSAAMGEFVQSTSVAAVDGYGKAALDAAGMRVPDARNRFNSGLPALLLERALGLGAGAFALDAACASSLYAIKHACDRLHDGKADLMLAGAVNCADDLCIHLGFTALQALSRSGRSRPFHADADGLVPAEGCGFVALKRLEDARRDGNVIHGVIRGIGLSNDGRAKGLLVPSEEGQTRAIRAAYDVAGVDPLSISLLECHATGTPVGDATEIRASGAVFAGHADLPIGSLKSNTGHLVTAAGVAGIIKACEAMRHGVRPPTLHVDDANPALDGTSLRLLTEAESWEADGPRRAGVSAFGFGGNNAHLVLEEPNDSLLPANSPSGTSGPAPKPSQSPAPSGPVAIVGIGIRAAAANSRNTFRETLLSGRSALRPSPDGSPNGYMDEIALPVKDLKFPPKDLEHTGAQQLVMLAVTREALDDAGDLPNDRTGVYVGMGTDVEAARYGVRWRLPTWAPSWGADAEWTESARDIASRPLEAAAVVGLMPNIPANRLNSQFDLAGPSHTVSAEERSGLVALDIATRALRSGDLDAAIVGAADMCCDPVHEAAARACIADDRQVPGDAAVAIVLKRLADAEADGDTIYAVIDAESQSADTNEALRLGPAAGALSLADRFGHAHAASALLHVAAGALALHHRTLLDGRPWFTAGERHVDVTVDAMDGLNTRSVHLVGHITPAAPPRHVPRLHVFSGADTEAVLDALAHLREGADGAARLVIVAADEAQFVERSARAALHIERGAPPGQGVHFRSAPVDGDMAFVFTAAGAAYHDMGADLLRAMPELLDQVSAGFPSVADTSWVFDHDSESSPDDYLWGTSMLSQAHAQLTRNVLGLHPDAVIGYSSGESNSLYAMGAWRDMEAMRTEIAESGMMDRELGVTFDAVARAWGEPADWQVWNVLANVDDVRTALEDEERVHLAIVNTAEDTVVAGDAQGCARIVAAFGEQRCVRLGYDLACHVPEVAAAFHEQWVALHTRQVFPVDRVRFYSNGFNGAYEPTPDRCAEAITRQAEDTLDFPATIEAAWNDGVRIFVEHGPGSVCSSAIRRILGDRNAVVVHLDRRGRSLTQCFEVAATLVAAGVSVDHERLTNRLTPRDVEEWTGPVLVYPAHRPPLDLPALPKASVTHPTRTPLEPIVDTADAMDAATEFVQTMAPAPALPSASFDAPVFAAKPATTRAPTTTPLADPAAPDPATTSPGAAPAPLQTLPPAAARIHAPAAASIAAETPVAETPVSETMDEGTILDPLPIASDDPLVDLYGTVQQQMSTLGQMHQDFLAQQSALHTRFLAMRDAALQALPHLAGSDGGSLPGSRPEVATRMPAERRQPDGSSSALTAPPTAPAPPPGPPATVTVTATETTVPRPPVSQALAPPAGTASASPTVTAPAARSTPEVHTPEPTPEVHTPETRPEVHTPETRPRSLAPTTAMPTATTSVAPLDPRPNPPTGNSRMASSATIDADGRVVFHPTGPVWDKKQLEIHSSGAISELFGPLFAQQDGYERQCRMPQPPLLLADRVTGLEAEPGVLGKGRMWTETDVVPDAYYLHDGYMPTGFMVESGQADLMLISYMGIDFMNKSERVYRLLGCTLTYHGNLPSPGETLEYEIRINGHAKHGDVRIFFFEYDCIVDGRPLLTVRDGQAGFFTDQELEDALGILWTPEEGRAKLSDDARVDAPAVASTKSSFTAEEVVAFSEGRTFDCFGPGFEPAETHTRSPRIQSGDMLFFDEVSAFDPTGGPWGRGYMRCESTVDADAWFFPGHFKNDPCMPGNFMVESCIEAMSFYLAGLGYTLDKDGWRFQPLKNQEFELKCRGEINPSTEQVSYELHVAEVWDGPRPTLICDLLGFVDGLPAFYAHRMGVQLVPDWPLTSMTDLYEGVEEPRPVATDRHGFPFDWKSLISCAWGTPSDSFGSIYDGADSSKKGARLPGPPYHFMSRIAEIDGDLGEVKSGMEIVSEYDIPEDAWYFDHNGTETMPHALVLEAAMQPCGWLACGIGSNSTVESELSFRVLHGTSTLTGELTRTAGTLSTHVKVTNVAKSGGMIIESFEVECYLGDAKVYEMDSVFGFFPPEALTNQVGLPQGEDDIALIELEGGDHVDLTERPAKYCDGPLTLPSPMLLMLDRADWFDGAGAAGLGVARGEKDVDVSEWFFKCHFFQDPVQPGSLGIEALLQLLQISMIELDLGAGMDDPRFEPIMAGTPMTWKYRGQVVPDNERITTVMEITEVGNDDRGAYVIGQGSVWCDGLRIYEVHSMGMRIVSGPPTGPSSGHPLTTDRTVGAGRAWPPERNDRERSQRERTQRRATSGSTGRSRGWAGHDAEDGPAGSSTLLDPTRDTWLNDHCPTWNRPALPAMSIVDAIAATVGGPVTAVRDVRVKTWCDFDGPRRLHASVEGEHVTLKASHADGTIDDIAEGRVVTGPFAQAPEALDPIQGEPLRDPYAHGDLFHGPAFQLVTRLVRDETGASLILDLDRSGVPPGVLNPAFLDSASHGIPNDRLSLWSDAIGGDVVGYPVMLPAMSVYGPTPTTGTARCEVRFAGFVAKPDLPRFSVQWIVDDQVWADATLVYACFPKGPISSLAPEDRRAMMTGSRYVQGVRLSRNQDGETRLNADEVTSGDWMPGTIAGVFGATDLDTVAVKEHLAGEEGLHPGLLPDSLPFTRFDLDVSHDGPDVIVRTKTPPAHETSAPRDFWNATVGTQEGWLGQDLWQGLMDRYVRHVIVTDPSGLEAVRGRPAIFLGNHQIQMESLLVTNLLPGLTGLRATTMANAKHEKRWIGELLRTLASYPGYRPVRKIVYFQQDRPETMFEILEELKSEMARGETAFFVHPTGTRQQSCRESVDKISSIFLDMALDLDVPLVPVRFSGGLPVEPITGKSEFPVGHGRQDYWVGSPISPDELRGMLLKDRSEHVLDAINSLGGGVGHEYPAPADPAFAAAVTDWQERTGAHETFAALWCILESLEDPGEETRRLLDMVHGGRIEGDGTPVGDWIASLASLLTGARQPEVTP